MAVNVQIYSRLSGRIDGEEIRAGSIEEPISISVTGNVHRRTDTIANGANSTVYNDELADFSVLYVVSDMNTRVLITDNASASMSLSLRGTGTSGKYGLPLILGLDETSNTTTMINAVQVFNNSGSTAKVHCIVIE